MTKVLIVPEFHEENPHQLISLPHPSTGRLTRYLVGGNPKAVYELTLVQKSRFQSMLICNSTNTDQGLTKDDENSNNNDYGSVKSSAELVISTLVSPLFFALQVLNKHANQFRTWEDLSDSLLSVSPAFRYIDDLLEQSISLICDIQEPAPGMVCFRLSKEKLFAHLSSKVLKIKSRLPQSVEKQFVTKRLAPVRFDVPTPNEMYDRARSGIATDIVASYLPPGLSEEFMEIGKDEQAKLHEYLASLEKERSIELTKQMFSAGGSGGGVNKRSLEEQEDKPANKPKKKALSINAARKQKIDTAGMKKMTSFFKKA
ncbi:ribonuclease H2, subunit B [Lipomyces japonicus]|uniref:ribonuclease H2, subunit B n=1 Tax=Lipomyces japonicus TaxID=56871 RepID=UPI0034D02176